MTGFASQSFIKRQDHVTLKEIEKEGILLNLKNGHYFVINELGVLIWKLLDGKKNLEQIAERIVSRYEVRKTAAFTDLLIFIKDLYKKDLIAHVNRRRLSAKK